MKLRCKIYAKYLDDILAGRKRKEYRQFESIVLTDENGRFAEFDISDTYPLSKYSSEKVMASHPDVPWVKDKRLLKIELGRQIITGAEGEAIKDSKEGTG